MYKQFFTPVNLQIWVIVEVIAILVAWVLCLNQVWYDISRQRVNYPKKGKGTYRVTKSSARRWCRCRCTSSAQPSQPSQETDTIQAASQRRWSWPSRTRRPWSSRRHAGPVWVVTKGIARESPRVRWTRARPNVSGRTPNAVRLLLQVFPADDVGKRRYLDEHQPGGRWETPLDIWRAECLPWNTNGHGSQPNQQFLWLLEWEGRLAKLTLHVT